MKTIKTFIITASLFISAISSYAVTEGWQTDFKKASKDAAEKKQPIMAVFSGSDWCSWCIKLDKEIFSQNEFKNFAKGKLVLFLADFPSNKQLPEDIVKQNKELAEKYKIEGFPTVLIMDPDGKVIGKTGYRAGGVDKYIKHLENIISLKKTGTEESK